MGKTQEVNTVAPVGYLHALGGQLARGALAVDRIAARSAAFGQVDVHVPGVQLVALVMKQIGLPIEVEELGLAPITPAIGRQRQPCAVFQRDVRLGRGKVDDVGMLVGLGRALRRKREGAFLCTSRFRRATLYRSTLHQ